MKHFLIPRKLFGQTWLVCAMLSTGLALPHVAFANGTAANTLIDNKASLTFTSGGGSSVTLESAPTGNTTLGVGSGTVTQFRVDRKVDILVTRSDAAIVTSNAGTTQILTTFNVQHIGNDTQDFVLTTAQLAAGTADPFGGASPDNFSFPAACTVRADNDNSGTYVAASDTLSYLSNIPAAAAGTTRKVFVLCDAPATTPNNSVVVVSLTAQAAVAGSSGATIQVNQSATADGALTVETVWGDAAGSDDAALDGKHSVRSAYLIRAAVLSLLKSETLICDPINQISNPKHIPGALVKYTVTVSNTGAASAILNALTDALDARFTFDTKFVAGSATAGSCTSAAGVSVAGASAGTSFRFVCGGTSTRSCTTAAFNTNAADTDAGSIAGSTVTINYTNGLPAVAGYAVGELKAGETVTVEFQAFLN